VTTSKIDFTSIQARDGMVVDLPLRKIAVFPNGSGNVVIASLEDGKQSIVLFEPEEIAELIAHLESAKVYAELVGSEIEADHAIWVAKVGGL
jgi:hypothetical protein